MTHPEFFTFPDLVMLTGLSERQARDWQRKGIIQASLSRSGVCLYTFLDVLLAHLAASLRHARLSLDVCRQAVEIVRNQEWDGEKTYLAIAGDEVTLATSREINRQMLRGVPTAHVNLLAAAEALREEIDSQREAVKQAEAKVN